MKGNKDNMADFLLSEDEKEVRDLARQYSDKDVAPIAKEYDAKHEFPRKQIEKLGELGLLGTRVPEEYGGIGLGVLSAVVVLEELARNYGGLAISVQSHIEPQSGSDAGGTRTHAELDGDEWVINGSKSWITNCGEAKYYLVACKTDKTAKGSKGISLIIVPNDAPGFSVGAKEQKLSVRSSSTGELFFDDCRVPKENLVGELNHGLPIFLEGLDEGRIMVSALSIGLAQGAFERAVRYAKQRTAFGRPITDFQAVNFKLAEMAEKIEIARCMCYTVAKMADSGVSFSKEAAMSKLFASQMADDVTRDAIQVMGANGISEEYEVERFFRDTKMMTIGEGTSEILDLVIGRHVLDEND